MSREIDEKIVSMEFDNSRFEKNVSTSMNSIDKLNKKLNFKDSSKGLEGVEKATKKISFKGMADGIETVHAKFSALEVMGITALTNITNSAVNAGKNLVKSLSVDQVTSGFGKYEEKTAAVQTLVNSTGKSVSEIEKVLEKLMWFSDETSYGFTDMATSLSTMVNAGGDITKLTPMIEGIANVTAFAGKGAAEFSRIMQYSVSQAFSKGYMGTQDWMTMQTANVNPKELIQDFIEAGEALGTIKKGQVTLDKFGESMKDKWITNDVMIQGFSKWAKVTEAIYDGMQDGTIESYADGLDKIGDKYGEVALRAAKSGQEAKSFTESIAAVKDAVSTSWMVSSEKLFGNYAEAVPLWTAFTDDLLSIFASGGERRNDFLDSLFNSGSKWSDITDEVTKTGVALNVFEDAFKKAAKSHGIAIDDMINEEGSLAAVIDSGKLSNLPGLIKETFKSFLDGEMKISNATSSIVADYDHLQETVLKVINGDFLNGQERIESMAAAGEDWASAQAMVDYIWQRNGQTWEDCTFTIEEMNKVLGEMSDEELKSVGYTQEQIDAFRKLAEEAQKTGTPISELIDNLGKPSGKELIIDSFRNILKSIIGIIETYRDAFDDFFPKEKRVEAVYKALEAFHKFTEKLKVTEEKAEKLKRVFNGLFAAIDIIRRVVGGGLSIAFRVLKAVLSALNIDILEGAACVGDAIVAFREWILEHDYLGKAIDFVVPKVVEFVQKIKEWFASSKLFAGGISGMAENAKSGFAGLLEKLKGIGASIKQWFADLKEGTQIGEYILKGLNGGLQNGFTKVISNITGFVKKMIATVKGLLGIHSPSTVFIAIGGFIVAGLVMGLTGNFPDVWKALTGLTEGIKEKFDGLDFKTIGKNIFDGFKGMIGTLVGDIKSLNVPTVLIGALGIGGFALMNKGLNVADKFANPVEKFGKVLNSVSNVIESASGAIKKISTAKTIDMYVGMIKKLAEAVLMIAAAMFVISMIPEDTFERAAWTIGIITGVLVAMFAAMMFLNKKAAKVDIKDTVQTATKSASMAGTIMAIAAAMLIVSMAVKKLGNMDKRDMDQGIVGLFWIVALMAALMLVTKAITKDPKGIKNLDSIGPTLLKISAAITAMGMIAKTLGEMKGEDLAAGIIAVVVLSGIIVGLMAATKLITGSTNVDKIGKTLLEIAGVILVMAMIVKKLGGMKERELERGENAVILFAGIIVGLIAASKLLKGDKYISTLGNNMLCIAGALIIMGLAVKILGGMSVGALLKGTFGVALLGVIIAGLMFVVKQFGTEGPKIGKTLASIAGAMLILSVAVAIMGMLDMKQILKGVFAIGAISAMMALLMVTAKYATGSEKVIRNIAATMAVLAAVVLIFSFIDPESLWKAIGAIGVLMAMLAILLVSSKLATGSAKTILMIAGVLALMAGVIWLLVSLDVDDAIKAAEAMSMLMIAVSAALILASLAGKDVLGALIGIAALTLMGIPMALFVAVLGQMSYIKGAAKNAETLADFLIKITGVLIAVSLLGPLCIIGEVVLFALAGLMVLFGAFAIEVGKMMEENPKLQEFLDKGLPILIKVADGMGRMVGAFIGGAVDQFISYMPNIASNLSLFMENLQPFLDGAREIDDKVKNGVEILVASIIALSIGNVIAGLSTVLSFGQDFATLGFELSAFTKLLNKDFIPTITSLDDSTLDGAKTLVNIILTLAEANLVNSIANILPGDQSLSTFASDIAALGKGLASYIAAFAETDAKAFNMALQSCDLITALANASTKIPNSGGWIANIVGDNDLGDWSTKLPAVAAGIVSFVGVLQNGLNGEKIPDGIKGVTITEEAVETAGHAADIIVKLSKASEGIKNDATAAISALIGNSDLSIWSSKLPVVGEGILGFIGALRGNGEEGSIAITEEDVAIAESAANIISKILEASEGINNDLVSVKAAFAGNSDMALWALELKPLGEGIKNFITCFRGIAEEVAEDGSTISATTNLLSEDDVKMASNAADIIKTISEAGANIEPTGGVWGWLAGDTDMGKWAENLSQVGSGVKDFVDALKGVTTEDLTTATLGSQLVQIITAMAGDSAIKDNLEDFAGGLNMLTNRIDTYIDTIGTIDQTKATNATAILTNFRAGLKTLLSMEGVSAKDINEFATAIDELATKGIDALLNKFKNSDEDIDGAIKELLDDVKSCVEGEALTVYKNAFKNAGKDFVKGLKIGLEDKNEIAGVKSAAYNLGVLAVNSEKKGQKSHSPSKATIQAGKWLGEGLIIGITQMNNRVATSANGMGQTAVNGLSQSIAKISDVIDSDVDVQPTIRPVLDLTDIHNGANQIGGLLGMNPSMRVQTNSIKSNMSELQNGNSDIIDAIKDLGEGIENSSGNTYSINGINYTESSDVGDAIKTLVRASRIDKRR